MSDIHTFECQVEQLSHEGRGIAKPNGKTTFIVGGLPGERLSARRIRRHRRYDDARALSVLSEPHPDRVTPLCDAFGRCGGCSNQHINHERQLFYKQQAVAEQFQSFAEINDLPWVTTLIGPKSHYRTKGRLGVRHVPKKGGVLVGFREQSSNYLTEMNDCPILAAPMDSLITPLKQLIANLSIPAQIPQIEFAVAENATALVFRHLQPFTDTDLSLLNDFGKTHKLALFLQPKGIDSMHLLYAPDNFSDLQYSYPAADITYHYQPFDFTQINLDINQKMITQAIDWLELDDTKTVLDLFCGLGNFSLPMAKKAKYVHGIEGTQEMVIRANSNAAHNDIKNTFFEAHDLANDIESQQWTKLKFDTVLLDPPRAGAKDLIPYLPQLGAQRIVYVSCQPASLARDTAAILATGLYRLTKIGLMDMFPHTQHVETMACFERISK